MPFQEVDNLDPKDFIIIKNARVNNLKNVSVAIPRNKLVVITGVSGCGKSSLAFDTLFAEGQRMYVESLSAYARQFMGRMQKPEVDYIKGISPAIAIEQKVNTRNPRSTVGTTTEIYDYLKLLFARIGKTYSPISGKEVKRDTVSDVVSYINTLNEGERVYILAPLHHLPAEISHELCEMWIQKGFTRLWINHTIFPIEGLLAQEKPLTPENTIYLLIDRVELRKDDEETQFRISDSVAIAFKEGEGSCVIETQNQKVAIFSDRFEADGIVFEEPHVNLFSFNNSYGACKTCEGFGQVLGIDPDKVIPNKELSVFEGAIAPWKGERMIEWQQKLIKNAHKFDFPIHRSYNELTKEQQDVLWRGNEYFEGIDDFFAFLEKESYKIQYRVMLSRYRGRKICDDCKGTRLRKDAQYVKITAKLPSGGTKDYSITDLLLLPLTEVQEVFQQLILTEHEKNIASRIVQEINTRLEYINLVGLGYLTLNRLTNTLSGGEFQRIKLATSLGSALVGSMYILDEPSIGLHPRDTAKMVSVLRKLNEIGNTVIVVEHEEEVMRAADWVIDMGPDAGAHGGTIVGYYRQADLDPQLICEANSKDAISHTLRYLTHQEIIPIPKCRRKSKFHITIEGARENNLKNIKVRFPLQVLCVVTGVSGSGKSTLIKKILYPAILKQIERMGPIEITGSYRKIHGDLHKVKQIEFVDQNPIGKSSRSNPVTYIKAYDFIRNLMSEQTTAKQRGYKPAHFSFNVEGGRCEACQGEGFLTVEMQFMADLHLVCESCKGKRFKQELLEVCYKGKNISEILELTVDEAIEFFSAKPRILEKLMPLQQVGLGYIRLGQPANTLSGGEAQRVKLAAFIAEGNHSRQEGGIMFIFDEPTTGLHFHDIHKLIKALQSLVNQGNTVIVIEHNMEIIKCADWIIDLGPEGGEKGGYLCFEGTPEHMAKEKNNHTASFLRQKLNQNA